MAKTPKSRPKPKPSRRPAAAAPHVPDLPPGTPATVPLSALHPSPFNKRRARPDAPEDRELTASIRALGVLEPLLVRPRTEDTYELLAGERRWRCAQAAGLAEAPVMIHQVDDRTACLLLFAENFHRQDLHFLEEAETVAGLLAAGWTHEQIAAHVDRSASWVARRARLCSLDEQVRAGIAAPDHPFSTWGVAHFEELALLDPVAQRELLAEYMGYLDELSPTALRQTIASRSHDLAKAPWRLDDEALVPEAGACAACPLRTSREPLLFAEEEWPSEGEGKRPRKAGPVDRCLQPGCWQRKTEALLARKEAELLARHPGAVRLSSTGRKDAVPSWRVERATRKTPGAVPALAVDGPDVGAVRWVTVAHPLPSSTFPSGSSRSASSPPIDTPAGPRRTTLAERKGRLQARRMLRAIESLVPDVEASAVVPPLAQVAALAAVFGTHHTHTCGWYTPGHELPASLADPPAEGVDPLAHEDGTGDPEVLADPQAEDLDPLVHEHGSTDPELLSDPPSERLYALAFEYGAADPALLAATLWQRVRPVLLARLKTNDRPEDAERAFAEARHLAQLVSLDAGDYLTRATTELPDPKSWAKEEAALQAAQPEASAASAEESTASSDDDSSLAGDMPPDDEDGFCPQCGGPLPPGRVLCVICDEVDNDPGDLDDLAFGDAPTPVSPLDAEALCD